jgi:hypothetical protein
MPLVKILEMMRNPAGEGSIARSDVAKLLLGVTIGEYSAQGRTHPEEREALEVDELTYRYPRMTLQTRPRVVNA